MFDIVLDIKITFVKFGPVIGVLVVVLGLLIFSNNSSGPSYVTVRGEVSTIGNGTSPTSVIFMDSSGNNITANLTNGHYSALLHNHNTYTIFTSWVGVYPYQHGVVKETGYFLDLQQGNATSRNIVAETPNMHILVSGNATTISGTSPYSITFNGYDNWTVTVPIVNSKYSVTLPNMVDYSVLIHYNQSTEFGLQPPTSECNTSATLFGLPSLFALNESYGVTDLVKNFSC